MIQPKIDPVFISDDELSREIRVPRSTLCLWRQSGQGPTFYQLGPRAIRYKRADVDAWLQANKSANGPDFPGGKAA